MDEILSVIQQVRRRSMEGIASRMKVPVHKVRYVAEDKLGLVPVMISQRAALYRMADVGMIEAELRRMAAKKRTKP